MNADEIIGFLRGVRLLSILGDKDLADIAAVARTVTVAVGEPVFAQGDPGDTFYLVYSGRVRILITGGDGKEANLGIRAAGEYFGEAALLTRQARNATVRAVENSVLLAITRDAFDACLAARPDIRIQFERFIRATAIHRFLESCTELAQVPPKQLQRLVARFEDVRVEAGQCVIRQGDEPDSFYLVEQGKLKVVRHDAQGGETIVNLLRSGDFFGEKALVERTGRQADVVTLTPCHLYVLSRAAFAEMMEESPKLRAVIEDRIRSYGTLAPPIPYRELIRQELAQESAAVGAAVGAAGVAEAPARPLAVIPAAWRERLGRWWRRRVFPFIRQHDEMSCGPTCLMMIGRYFGKRFSSGRLRELAFVDRSGASLANLEHAARSLGMSARARRVALTELAGVALPCVGLWRGFHYVVVYRVRGDRVWVCDPAFGRRVYRTEDFGAHWNGVVLEVSPTEAFAAQEDDPSNAHRFLDLARGQMGLFGRIAAVSLLLNALGLAMPVFTQKLVDQVVAGCSLRQLHLLLAGMLVVVGLRFGVTLLRQRLVIRTSTRLDLRMLSSFYRHLLSLPLGYFRARKIGDFVTRFGENRKIRQFLANTALTMVLDTMLVVVYLSVMFYYQAGLAVIVLLLLPLLALVTAVFTPRIKRLSMDSFAARAEADSHVIESFHGVEAVKAMHMEVPIRRRWGGKFVRNLRADVRFQNTAVAFFSLSEFVGAAGAAVVLWCGAQHVLTGSLSVGALMAFMALMGSVMGPVNRMLMAWDDIQETLMAADRLGDVFSARSERAPLWNRRPVAPLVGARGAVEFRDVYFRYGGPDAPYILSGINLKVEPGRTVAIVGRSGSGKSTLVQLLPRFHDVTGGSVLLDGQDVRSLALDSLRQAVGMVLQDGFVFSGSIRENILMGAREAAGMVEQAAKRAFAHDFITALPLGYNTPIGESGLQLSGGQRQRICMARVLYRDPRVLVLDEATSNLDSESEQAIQRNLREILRERTAIVIAHRLSTIRGADEIVVLDAGEIVERGAHEALMERKGLYHYLVHQQLSF